jgi:hypothetical protein
VSRCVRKRRREGRGERERWGQGRVLLQAPLVPVVILSTLEQRRGVIKVGSHNGGLTLSSDGLQISAYMRSGWMKWVGYLVLLMK